MPRALSVDLRQRVVRSVENGGLSRRQAAARFGVGISTVVTWVRQFRQSGRLAPNRVGGCKPRTLRGEHRDWLLQRCRDGDFTLRGLVAELAERGLTVDYHSVWDFVHAEKLSFKKKPARQRTGPAGRRPQAGALDQGPRPRRPGPPSLHR
jgi:putative transposase